MQPEWGGVNQGILMIAMLWAAVVSCSLCQADPLTAAATVPPGSARPVEQVHLYNHARIVASLGKLMGSAAFSDFHRRDQVVEDVAVVSEIYAGRRFPNGPTINLLPPQWARRSSHVKLTITQKITHRREVESAPLGRAYVAENFECTVAVEEEASLHFDEGMTAFELVAPYPRSVLQLDDQARVLQASGRGYQQRYDRRHEALQRSDFQYLKPNDDKADIGILARHSDLSREGFSPLFSLQSLAVLAEGSDPVDGRPTTWLWDAGTIKDGLGWSLDGSGLRQLLTTGSWTERIRRVTESDRQKTTVEFVINLEVLDDPRVVFVDWKPIDGNLDPNPNTAAGWRIYPGKRMPVEPSGHPFVRVEARVTPPVAGIRVHFRAFDVDDPSTDKKPADPNGRIGNDNRGFGFGGGGMLVSESAVTDDQGHATITFVVESQPGDNFRVAASTNRGALKLIGTDGHFLLDAGTGRRLPTLTVKDTDLLTVWRKLHIEVDSMGPVTGNEIEGVINEIHDANIDGDFIVEARTDVNLVGDDPSPHLDGKRPGLGRFENGMISITGESTTVLANGQRRVQLIEFPEAAVELRDTHGRVILIGITPPDGGLVLDSRTPDGPVWKITARWDQGLPKPEIEGYSHVRVQYGDWLPAVDQPHVVNESEGLYEIRARGPLGIPFVLRDDDQVTGAVPAPDTSALPMVLAPAYIHPVVDVGDFNEELPFLLNTTGVPGIALGPAGLEPTGSPPYWDFDAEATKDDFEFWTIYLLGAFQASEGRDGDPTRDLSSTLGGQSYHELNGAEIYAEQLSEKGWPSRLVTAHEVGHLLIQSKPSLSHPAVAVLTSPGPLRDDHDDGGIMTSCDGRSFQSNRFTAISLNKMRSIPYP